MNGAEPVVAMPDILKPLWIKVYPPFIAVGVPGPDNYIHKAESTYCKFKEDIPGVRWRVGFEDLDEEFGYTPDYDYDEPLLFVTLRNGGEFLDINIFNYGTNILNSSSCDLYYGDTLLFKGVGGSGIFPRHTGETYTLRLGGVPPTYTCPYCGAIFDTQEELDAHITSQHPSPGFIEWLKAHKGTVTLVSIAGIVTGIVIYKVKK